MRSAITVCLVEAARGGPFVYHAGLADGCQRAADLGYDAVEVFPASAEALDQTELRRELDKHSLQLAALGTGAGWVTQQLSLSAADPRVRQQAVEFIKQIIDVAGSFRAPAIIGSMQGRVPAEMTRTSLLKQLAETFEKLGEHAARYDVPLLLEPLNRYESNVFNTLDDTAQWLRALRTKNIRILADMFHMNIEEADMAQSIRDAADLIGHVHFADSNRRAIGLGHCDANSVIDALRDIGYQGYLSAEIFPLPDAGIAARKTIESFRSASGRCRQTSETC